MPRNPRPPRAKENAAREDKIAFDIVVDCYDEVELAMGWHCYLDDALHFPFEARCTRQRNGSPLRQDEVVQVVAMADADDCRHEMFVLAVFDGRSSAVPLGMLEPTDSGSNVQAAERAEAVADWHYWQARGYTF